MKKLIIFVIFILGITFGIKHYNEKNRQISVDVPSGVKVLKPSYLNVNVDWFMHSHRLDIQMNNNSENKSINTILLKVFLEDESGVKYDYDFTYTLKNDLKPHKYLTLTETVDVGNNLFQLASWKIVSVYEQEYVEQFIPKTTEPEEAEMQNVQEMLNKTD